MRIAILTFLFIAGISGVSFAQKDFAVVDAFVLKYKGNTTDIVKLTNGLTTGFDNEMDKLRAIFFWIANNIEYDCKKYKKTQKEKSVTVVKKATIKASSKEELAAREKAIKDKWDKDAKMDSVKQLKDVLVSRRGICQDYANLVVAMCRLANIRAGLIEGSVREANGRIVVNDHVWNWVEIKGKTYLLDVTWASGYVTDGYGAFVKKYNDGFFLTDPQSLIINHLPLNLKWQLLKETIAMDEFKEYPVVGSAFFQYKAAPLKAARSMCILKGKELSLSVKFANVPAEISIAINGKVIKTLKSTSKKLKEDISLSAKGREVSVWADKELLFMCRAK